MPHGTERPVAGLLDTDLVKSDAWQQQCNNVLLVACNPIGNDVLQGLYRRDGICADKDDLIPFVKARHRRYVLACFERDSRAMDMVLAKHDTLFTLAS